MGWNDAFKIFTTTLISIGGAGVMIFGLSNWLGKVWAGRILERERKLHQKDIEKYKYELDELKTNSLRYSGKQFELYNDLWLVMCDLAETIDRVIDDTSAKNVVNFVNQLSSTKKKVKRSFLFLEKPHYTKLMDLLHELRNLQDGKVKLYSILDKIKTKEDFKNFNGEEYRKIISENQEIIKKYNKLFKEIGYDLKSQLSPS